MMLGGSSARASGTRFDDNGAAVVASGNPVEMTCGEGVDLAELGLPEGQSALLDAVAGTTVQLYVRRVLGGTSWPRVRELRGFARIELVPGERAEVSFPLGARTLASVTRSWERAVEPGEFTIETGPSSDRTRGARLTVAAPPSGICR